MSDCVHGACQTGRFKIDCYTNTGQSDCPTKPPKSGHHLNAKEANKCTKKHTSGFAETKPLAGNPLRADNVLRKCKTTDEQEEISHSMINTKINHMSSGQVWNGTSSQVVKTVSLIFSAMAQQASPSERFTCFHSAYAPKINIHAYLVRIHQRFECSRECLVLAVVYIERLVKINTKIVFSDLSSHRLILTAVMVAAKFHDDIFYSNIHYATVGGVSARELGFMERRFLQLLDWQLLVQTEEFALYSSLLHRICSRKCSVAQ